MHRYDSGADQEGDEDTMSHSAGAPRWLQAPEDRLGELAAEHTLRHRPHKYKRDLRIRCDERTAQSNTRALLDVAFGSMRNSVVKKWLIPLQV